MLISICAAVLVGALLGLRFKAFILPPATMLALLSVVVVGAAEGEPAMSILVATFSVCAALQLSYLAGVFAFVAVAPANQMELPNIRGHLEVVGVDGEHVGTVDRVEDAQCLILTGDDPKAGGRPHLISIDWVEYVNDKVHLNKPSNEVVSEWLVAA